MALLGSACSSSSSGEASSPDSGSAASGDTGGALQGDSSAVTGLDSGGEGTTDGNVIQPGVDSGAVQPGIDGSVVDSGGGGVEAGAAADAGPEAGKDAAGTDAGPGAGNDASPVADAAAKDASGTDAGSSNPFDCKFAWGEPVPSGSLSSDTWLQFMTNWAGYEIAANGSITTFDNGGFIKQVEPTNLIPVYYTYLIGYYGHANNLPDQNCCGSSCVTCTASQPNLATGAAYLLLSDPTGANAPCASTTTFCSKNLIVQAYAYYAQQTYAVWKTKPFVWLMEGDFIQYSTESGSQVASLTSTTGAAAGLSYSQLGQLAALITTAIKSNMPNAIVAFDDSAWVSDKDRPLYWQGLAQAGTNFDMVWTTGVGNNPPFLNSGQKASDSDGMTGTYSWLNTNTGKKILVDESAGASEQADTWSNQTAATLNSLIADGVVAVNVNGAPSTYQANVTALEPKLNSTCP
jgi:hypothetical protein